MADAISTGNPVKMQFNVNKYDDIGGSRVSQLTGRGRFCFIDTTGYMTLPRTFAEANKAVIPVDWAKPLNPGPYFNTGDGLNGSTFNPFSDGSLGSQESGFAINPDTAFSAAWPAAITVYDVPPLFYNVAVPSGAKCLTYNGEAVVTYGSGNYDGYITDYALGSKVYASLTAGKLGCVAPVAASGVTVAIGVVLSKGVFGDQTLTITTRGLSAI